LGPGPATVLLVSGLLGAIAALFLPKRPARLALAVAAVAMLATASMQRALDGQAHSSLTAPRDARAAATITATLTDDPDGGPYNARVLARVTRIGGRSAGAAPCSSPPAATPPASCACSSRATRSRCRAGSSPSAATTSAS